MCVELFVSRVVATRRPTEGWVNLMRESKGMHAVPLAKGMGLILVPDEFRIREAGTPHGREDTVVVRVASGRAARAW